MSLLALTTQLRTIEVELASLFLDPNNPRFADSSSVEVPDEDIALDDIQARTRRRMIKEFAVEKLRMNMEVNGYLPIDRIIVREFADDQYVVLEGNRRICAAKMISNVAKDGSSIADDVLDSLKSIPALQYTGGDHHNAAWIFQGLRHISGVEDWSAFNKAKLLVEQMELDSLSLTDVGKRFGLTPHGAGQWVRGFNAFKQAREESDFIDEVDERSYPYFQELFSRSSSVVRDWMDWNEQDKKFANLINFNEFVGWLYPRPGEDEDDEESSQGDWDSRLIGRRDDIRTLAFLMREDPELFQQFRATGKLEEAYSQALTRKYEKESREKADAVKSAFEAIRGCSRALEDLPLKVAKDPGLNAQLAALLAELQEKIDFVKSPS